MHRKQLKLRVWILFLLIFWNSGCQLLEQGEIPATGFEVTFLDVGQGDASLLQSPQHEFALIDGGPDPDILKNALQKNSVKTLEWVMITHADQDHYGGLVGIMADFSIHKIYLPRDTSTSDGWKDLLIEIARLGIPADTLFFGDEISFGGSSTLDILWPLRTSTYERNNASTVAIFTRGASRILFTGDLEAEAELELQKFITLESVNLLKVPHHGSKSSSTLPFLAALSPDWAVISCDSSVYGHPHTQTLARLEQVMGTSEKILRTDVQGSIKFAVNKKSMHQVHLQED